MREDSDGLDLMQQAMQDLEMAELCLVDDGDIESAVHYINAAYQHCQEAHEEAHENDEATDPGL